MTSAPQMCSMYGFILNSAYYYSTISWVQLHSNNRCWKICLQTYCTMVRTVINREEKLLQLIRKNARRSLAKEFEDLAPQYLKFKARFYA